MTRLRLYLTWLYTATTSLILALALTSLFLLRSKETRQAQLEQFYATWNSLSFRLTSDTIISQSFLAQAEAASQSVIHIEENGIPLLYHGSWVPFTDRRLLIEKTKEQAAAQGILTYTAPVSSSSASTSLLTIKGENQDQYYAMVLVLSHQKTVRSLCYIYYCPPALHVLKKTLIVFFGLGIAGSLCLLFFSWHFVGWSLRPVEESRRKQAEFIAAASHELRSPLAVLRSGAAAMLAAPDQKESLLKTMDAECVRMSHLIDDMLLLASADAKTWDIHIQNTDMDTLLIEIYEAFLPVCREKQLTLHLDLPDASLPNIQADPERIRQLLLILLDNALSYTPAGRQIQIRAQTGTCIKNHCASLLRTKSPANCDAHLAESNFQTRSRHRYLILQVIDEGCGIPDDQKIHIFDRFYRADKARSSKSHFGLGLSIAKELVLLHKGTITITDNPDGGSCFSIILPFSL